MKGWRQAVKCAVLQLFNQMLVLPPEQSGPAERQQRAGRAIPSSNVQAPTFQLSKLPFYSVLYCSPVENMLSGAATGQNSPPPPAYNRTEYDLWLTTEKKESIFAFARHKTDRQRESVDKAILTHSYVDIHVSHLQLFGKSKARLQQL